MNKLSHLLAVLVQVWTGSAIALPLTYVLEGDLKIVVGLDHYELNGAHFIWTIQTDTSYTPIVSNTVDYTAASFPTWDVSVMHITNRPYGAANISSDVRSTVPVPSDSTARNNYTGSPFPYEYDSYGFTSASLSEFVWLHWNGPDFYFPKDYWADGEVPTIPTDFSQIVDSYWQYWDGQPQFATSYEPINWGITAKLHGVPTPATLALLSIGLVGLGWSRRKQHG